MTKYGVVLITVPNEDLATKIANVIIKSKLAACVNIVPKIRSIYSWQGEICDEQELLLIIKTKPSAFEDLKEKVIDLHDYRVPEIIFLPIEDGLRDYLKWIDENVVS